MKKFTRILIVLVILLGLSALVLGIDWLQRKAASITVSTTTPLPPGSIPIYMDGVLVNGFVPTDLEKLQKVSFTDAAENKLQEGWLLRDIILLYVPIEQLKPETRIVVTSASRNKSAELTWAEVQDPVNMVMFDLSNRGTLKLVSVLPKLGGRDEWVQDSDRIEIITP
jgi:hypothetical protein